MTAPGGSPVQELVRTLFLVKNYQQQQAAAELDRQRFGLQQEQFGLQAGATHENQVGALQGILSQMQHPEELLKHKAELAKNTGFSEDLISTLIQNQAPSTETTRAGAVNRGAKVAGSKFDEAATAMATTGQTPGALQGDALHGLMSDQAQRFLSSQPADKQLAFGARVAEKLGSGMTPGQATLDALVDHLTPEEKMQAVKVGKGLAPSASEEDQVRLGYLNAAIQRRHLEAEDALREADLRIQQNAAKNTLSGKAFETANQLLIKRDELLQALMKQNTLTPEGKASTAAQINAYNKQLKALAPDTFKDLPDLPADKTNTAQGTGFLFRGKVFP